MSEQFVDPRAGKVCDQCGAPCTSIILRTLIQARPVKGPDGLWHKTWDLNGPKDLVYRCQAHPSQTEEIDGPEYLAWLLEQKGAKK